MKNEEVDKRVEQTRTPFDSDINLFIKFIENERTCVEEIGLELNYLKNHELRNYILNKLDIYEKNKRMIELKEEYLSLEKEVLTQARSRLDGLKDKESRFQAGRHKK